ncbi:oxidoreductase domain protein [Methylocaldum marinum]|uniref:Oxidoreductase domain protein n=1 Tax=Methylocaldum marinum TaxID=1432792 RepID=A0A250KVF9_9GAMM|nr:hypothetical protein [Methylocaldum marinum]BBA35663.1 oxidoreductase domain protein [Methylocaldum marinum]
MNAVLSRRLSLAANAAFSVSSAPLILPLLAFQADRTFPGIIERMAAAALGTSGGGQMRSNGGALARLVPNLC